MVVVVTVAAVGCSLGVAGAAGIAWHASLPAALQAAKQSGKLVMLSQQTEWCTWCQKLARETWPAPAVVEKSAQFECVQINAEKDEIEDRYKASGFPTILFLTADGEVAKRIEGYLAPEQFVKAMDEAVEGAKRLGEIKALEKKLAENPGDRALAVQIGELQIKMGNAKRALELLQPVYEKLGELEESLRAAVLLGYGEALVIDEQFEKGRTVLQEFVTKCPGSKQLADGHFVLGVALANLGKVAEARDEWQKTLTLDPKGPFAEQATAFIERANQELGGKQ
jgi:thioredoxin-related protein